MKISTKGLLCTPAYVRHCVNDAVEPVRLKDVAERQSISVKYLEQIISQLVRAGYVKSIRGPQGGYRLVKAPKEYTVGMILRQVEGNMVPVACLEDEESGCERQSQCVTLRIWKELDEAMRSVLDKYTLADLMTWQMELGDDYVI